MIQKLIQPLQEPFRIIRRELGGNRYLVDENGFVIATDGDNSQGKHLGIDLLLIDL